MGVGTYDRLIALFTEESALKRPNTEQEVGAVAVLLASDVARNITGCLFPIDGGTMPY
jgi:enoyl-[acyl-carrier-protein] reductase (NADH)